MIPNQTPTTFIMLTIGALTFIFIMFLPALLELKKPKDAGPRLIMKDVPIMRSKMREAILITNMEEEQKSDQTLIRKIADVIAVLPNLEV